MKHAAVAAVARAVARVLTTSINGRRKLFDLKGQDLLLAEAVFGLVGTEPHGQTPADGTEGASCFVRIPV